MENNKEKILVLGTSRGGTTLICAALGAHPDIAMLDEDLHDAINKVIGGKIAGNKLCVPNQIELDRKWKSIFSIVLINGFLRKSLFMSKIPLSPYSIRDYDNFSAIRHVCILRHPHGVISSIKKREKRSEKVAVYRWSRCLNVFKSLNNDDKYDPIFISFEKLLEDPERVLQELCKRLNIEFSKNMLEAPSKNNRYGGKKFDSSKANYDNKDAIWSILHHDNRSLYEELLSKCI